MTINTRKATKNDYIPFRNLMVQLQQHHINLRPDVYKITDQFFSEDEYIKLLETSQIILATNNEEIIGAVCYNIREMRADVIHSFKCLWISDLIIDESYRGKGIGTMLMEKVKETAKENSVDRIQLNVSSYNTDAVKLYEKLGFTPELLKMEYILK